MNFKGGLRAAPETEEVIFNGKSETREAKRIVLGDEPR